MAETIRTGPQLPETFTFSQSSLQDYVDCPRRFQLRYLDHLLWPAVETAPVLENERRQIEGQQFHRMVQQHLIGLPAEKLARMANTPDLARWWDSFLGHGPTVDGFNLHPELSLAAPLGRHRLVAKYDLVAVSPDKALIFDWKTYRKRPEDVWMSMRLQTRVYRALLVIAGAHLNGGKPFRPEQVEMQYWYPDFPAEPARFSYSEALYQHDRQDLAALVDAIDARQSFPMTDDEKKCAFCPYRSYCDRGTAAGKSLDAETEMPDFDVNIEQVQEIEF